ncbi:MAG TPA: CaiB/BaiF CoA-transferase family protein [Mycobacteriales bacterium]|jgi:alpha-methylacyl-CoA racemase|nr:CaiB/BaiF CoA-transferase family protein [Mycobacteriales bacterium]
MGPLAGVRILELAGIGPAPLACRLLADLGAQVLRVERAGGAIDDGLAAGRARVEVDLKDAGQVATVLAAAATADVLVEGMRPGVAERLGLGPEACSARNPRLVYARMTGWGQDGPLAQRAGHDLNYLSLTGALHAIGPAGKPVVPLNLVADFGGGSMFLVTGVLAALVERERSGAGQVVDVAMVDGVSQLMGMTWSMYSAGSWRDERAANLLDGGAPFYDTYACSDGRWVAVGAIEPQFYAQLVAGLGLDGLPGQYDDWPATRAAFSAAFATRSRDEWAEVFAGTDACVTPVLSLAEAPDGGHLAARGTLLRDGSAVRPAPAPRFARTPGAVPSQVPGGKELLARWAAG